MAIVAHTCVGQRISFIWKGLEFIYPFPRMSVVNRKLRLPTAAPPFPTAYPKLLGFERFGTNWVADRNLQH